MFGSKVARGKIIETKAGLERDVQVITAWAVRNGRLPDSSEYPSVFGTTPVDSWGKPVVYAYDSNLKATSTGGICGRSGTSITFNGQDIAFLLLSGGDDMGITSTPGVNGAFNGALTGLVAEDLYRIVTLKELQAQAGCDGPTQGSLKILNNELPSGCIPQSYKVKIFAEGGVPPVSFSYTDRPSWLTPIGATFATLSGNTMDALAPSYPVNVTATDAATNTVKRSYILNIAPSCN